MEAIILRVRNKTRFKFGTVGIDETSINRTSAYFHSDTLFSALVNSYFQVSDNTDEFVEKLTLKNDAVISSGCFCLEKNEKYIFFLHKPISLNLLLNDDTQYKLFKDILFVSKKIWELGISPDQMLDKSICTIIGNKFICLNEELFELDIRPKSLEGFQPYSIQILPKVTIHTIKSTERLYFQASVELNQLQSLGLHTHYYFLLEDNNEIINDGLLELLCTNGIGGELNIGCGKIEDFIRVKMSFEIPSSEYLASTSLIFPENLDEVKNLKYYQIISRGGRKLGNGKGWLNQVRGFREGCLVRNSINKIGCCPEISTFDNNYFRYGKGFLVPISSTWLSLIKSHEEKFSNND